MYLCNKIVIDVIFILNEMLIYLTLSNIFCNFAKKASINANCLINKDYDLSKIKKT